MPDNNRDVLIYNGIRIQSGYYHLGSKSFYTNSDEICKIHDASEWAEMIPKPNF